MDGAVNPQPQCQKITENGEIFTACTATPKPCPKAQAQAPGCPAETPQALKKAEEDALCVSKALHMNMDKHNQEEKIKQEMEEEKRKADAEIARVQEEHKKQEEKHRQQLETLQKQAEKEKKEHEELERKHKEEMAKEEARMKAEDAQRIADDNRAFEAEQAAAKQAET